LRRNSHFTRVYRELSRAQSPSLLEASDRHPCHWESRWNYGCRRKTNKHLPQRVYLYHGRYWFMERTGQRRDLGTTEAEMCSKLAEFADRRTPLRTRNHAFDRYLLESLPHLAPRTQRDYRAYIENLRRSLGEAAPEK